LWLGLCDPTSSYAAGEVRVRLRHELTTVNISGVNIRISATRIRGEFDGSRKLRRVQIIHPHEGVWIVYWDGGQIPVKISAMKLWLRGEMLSLGSKFVPGELEIGENSKRGLDVIARLSLDSYLAGVLPAEMPLSWPLESLKAQVVAARSFVLRQISDRRDQTFDVEATINDQVYTYVGQGRTQTEEFSKVRRAVQETQGEVLYDQERKVLKAFYSADCGCQSEDPKFVWGSVESFVSVKDSSCHTRRPIEWRMRLPREELRAKLIRALDLPVGTELDHLQISSRTPSGRVAKVMAMIQDKGATRTVTLDGQKFRRIFGFQRVQSEDFTFHWRDKILSINGIGLGHGVGLCQRGARTWAEQGRDHRAILKTYYPLAQLVSLSSSWAAIQAQHADKVL
jgi:stage II sporulation protein D